MHEYNNNNNAQLGKGTKKENCIYCISEVEEEHIMYTHNTLSGTFKGYTKNTVHFQFYT